MSNEAGHRHWTLSRLHTVLSFFALPAERQIELLPEIPRDRGAPDYYTALGRNPLLLLVRGVPEEHSRPEPESDSDYQARTGLHPGGPSAALNELCSFIYLLRHHHAADDYWTQRALAGRDEWRLFRRLAGLALEEAGWTVSCAREDLRAAVDFFQREFAHA